MKHQPALALTSRHPPEYVVGNANMLAYRFLCERAIWHHPVCWLEGEEGSGKTFLAQTWQRHCDATRITLSEEPDALPHIATGGHYWIDPLPQDISCHVSLFHLLNQIKDRNARLLLCSRMSPAHYPTRLADVHSRLMAAHILKLTAPDDAMLRAVILAHFASRQLRTDDATISYLLKRLPRTCGAVAQTVDAMDAHALASHQPPSIQTARAVITSLFAAEDTA